MGPGDRQSNFQRNGVIVAVSKRWNGVTCRAWYAEQRRLFPDGLVDKFLAAKMLDTNKATVNRLIRFDMLRQVVWPPVSFASPVELLPLVDVMHVASLPGWKSSLSDYFKLARS